MARRISTKVAEWIKANQGKHLCQCGCGQAIPITRMHYTYGIACFRRGHNMAPPGSEVQRFWAMVEKTEGCWLWQGNLSATHGYGMLHVGKSKMLAHRFAYQLLVGPIPDGLFVCHHCDNRGCVNPGHPFVGTARDNARDMMDKGRGPQQAGEKNPRAKLTVGDVRSIRSRAAGGATYKSLAREYGMDPSTIADAVKGITWHNLSLD